MTQSLWMEETLPEFQVLESNQEAAVCIIGAGMAGLCCAYELAKRGKSVIVLERKSLAEGETLRTTAHLTWELDERYQELVPIYGETHTRLIADSHAAAIDYIEKVVTEEQIDCDFTRINGYLFSALGSPKQEVNREQEVLAHLGLSLQLTDKGLLFPHQAKFHIGKYIRGLTEAITKYGGKIYTHTTVTQIEDDAPCTIQTEAGPVISAKQVIVATCTPINDRYMIHTKQAPYRTYVIAAEIPKDHLEDALYWDTAEPYHYIRTQKSRESTEFDWLIIGGKDHKTGQMDHYENLFSSLEEWARLRYPEMGKVKYRWSGQIFAPVDSAAFIGQNPHEPHTYIVTGHSGNGMTYGAIAALLIPDLIEGKNHPWKEVYDPARKSLSSWTNFLKENANVAVQYTDWLTPGEIEHVKKLPSQEGAILREGMEKLAVYKDENEQVHIYSAICPHLWGCVHWNPIEKTWDCPCHGSRFDKEGNTICGPAIKGLEKRS